MARVLGGWGYQRACGVVVVGTRAMASQLLEHSTPLPSLSHSHALLPRTMDEGKSIDAALAQWQCMYARTSID